MNDKPDDADEELTPEEIEELAKTVTTADVYFAVFRFFWPAIVIIAILWGAIWLLDRLR